MKLTRCDVCGKDGPLNPLGWIEIQPATGKSIWVKDGLQHMAWPLHACSLICVANWVQQRIHDEALVVDVLPVGVRA